METIRQYNALSTAEKIQRFFPGVTLPITQRNKLPHSYTSLEIVSVAVIGPPGCGKSAFINSCRHHFQGLLFSDFEKRIEGEDIGINMVEDMDGVLMIETSPPEIGKLRLVDSVGIPELLERIKPSSSWTVSPWFFGSSPSQPESRVIKLFNEIMQNETNYWSKLTSFLSWFWGQVNFPSVQSLIVIWSAESPIEELTGIRSFCQTFKEKMFEQSPIILVTNIDRIHNNLTFEELERVVHKELLGCTIFFIQNYTEVDTEDRLETDETINSLISVALTKADSLAYALNDQNKSTCQIL